MKNSLVVLLLVLTSGFAQTKKEDPGAVTADGVGQHTVAPANSDPGELVLDPQTSRAIPAFPQGGFATHEDLVRFYESNPMGSQILDMTENGKKFCACLRSATSGTANDDMCLFREQNGRYIPVMSVPFRFLKLTMEKQGSKFFVSSYDKEFKLPLVLAQLDLSAL